MTEHFRTGSKKGRGMAQASRDMIDTMYDVTSALQPITGRGVGYKLFTKGLIASMSRSDMAQVYRLLLIAREQGTIPWDWIVDETRQLERVSTWDDPEEYSRAVARSYRRDFWNHQPRRIQVWSEKGTVRGVLKPILDDKYAVGFLPVGGFSSGTKAYDVASDDDGRPLVILYVGDIDPSGMFMSEVDLPGRFAKYGGDHITIKRIALTLGSQVDGLPSFPASDKGPKKNAKGEEKGGDPRYAWFVRNYGDTCWELDAMNPNDLRDCVEQAIVELIEPIAWKRCAVINKAEQESMRSIMTAWAASRK